MGAILVTKGDWKKTKKFLNNLSKQDYLKILNSCAAQGVEALAKATPKNSGVTADSWGYEIESNDVNTTIVWTNDNFANGWFPVAIMLQYGHGTGTGGYVKGVDYINPAIKPVFDNIADTVWKVVQSL